MFPAYATVLVESQDTPSGADLYRSFFHQSGAAFFIMEKSACGKFELSEINPATAALIGKHGDAFRQFEAAMLGMAENMAGLSLVDPNTHLEHEEALTDDSGRALHLKILLSPTYTVSGELIRIMGSISEVSAQKANERLLDLRDREFERLADNLAAGVVRFDRRGRRIYANASVLDVYNLPIDRVIGSHPRVLPGGEVGKLYAAQVETVFETGAAVKYTQEWELDGRNYCCDIHLLPEHLPNGEVGSVLAIGQDFTDRQEKQLLEHESRQDFNALADQSPDAVICYDSLGECTYLNQSARLLCSALAQPEGSGRLVPINEAKESAIHTVLRNGEPLEQELAWTSADGVRYHYHMRYVAKHSLRGDITAVIAIGRNIAKLKQTEASLNEAEAYLSELHLQMNDMMLQRENAREAERQRIGQELHDELGQLLTALRYRLASLRPQLGGGDKKKIEDALDIVDRAGQEVRQIAYSSKPPRLDIGLSAALRELAADFSTNSGTTVALSLFATELPFSETEAAAVFRIVQESLTNIVRHAQAAKASVTLESTGGDYHLTISDDGRGFDLSALNRHTLGLTGIRDRVMMLKGTLSLQSTPGNGTVIQISIPQNKKKQASPND